MKTETHDPKCVRHSKSKSKREAHSNISLSKESRETSNKQPNFTPKATRKRTKNTQNQ